MVKIINFTMSTEIYHERQCRQLCALHTLNNLFQAKCTYTKKQLDEICIQLNPSNWLNPHRSMIGLGNYDINVIMAALQQRDCDTVWFDKRRDPACLNLKDIFGLILNLPSNYKLGFIALPFELRHWLAIRRIDGEFFNLDSKLDKPQLIGGELELLEYLRQQLQCNDRELFIVMRTTSRKRSESSNQPLWLKEESETNVNENGGTN